MKIALCFYGLVGSSEFKHGLGKPLNPRLCAEYYKKNFLDLNETVDIFVHSQSIEFKDQINEIYKPCKSIIEKKKTFFFQALFHPNILLSILGSLRRMDFRFKYFREKVNRANNYFSRWYSTQMVMKLKKKYEEEKNFNYDLVFLTRLDWAFLKPLVLTEKMKNKFTLSNHNDVPSPRNNYEAKVVKKNLTQEKGFADYWFIGNSKDLDKFSDLYDKKYFYPISPHFASMQHAKYLKLNVEFLGWRGEDHEMMRRLKKSYE